MREMRMADRLGGTKAVGELLGAGAREPRWMLTIAASAVASMMLPAMLTQASELPRESGEDRKSVV